MNPYDLIYCRAWRPSGHGGARHSAARVGECLQQHQRPRCPCAPEPSLPLGPVLEPHGAVSWGSPVLPRSHTQKREQQSSLASFALPKKGNPVSQALQRRLRKGKTKLLPGISHPASSHKYEDTVGPAPHSRLHNSNWDSGTMLAPRRVPSLAGSWPHRCPTFASVPFLSAFSPCAIPFRAPDALGISLWGTKADPAARTEVRGRRQWF